MEQNAKRKPIKGETNDQPDSQKWFIHLSINSPQKLAPIIASTQVKSAWAALCIVARLYTNTIIVSQPLPNNQLHWG